MALTSRPATPATPSSANRKSSIVKAAAIRPSSDMRSRYERTIAVIDAIEALPNSLRAIQAVYGTPTLVQQYWVPSILALTASLIFVRNVTFYSASLTQTFSNAYETVSSIAQDYIFTPFKQIYNTIRHRERRLALMGSDSLAADLNSLERMVVDFAKDHHRHVADSELDAIRFAVQRGDLSVVLKSYEEDLKAPLSSAVTGDLIRSLLIQVQKSKVDLELAMSALDKLLQANELNFTIMSMVPIVLISYGAYSYVRSWLRKRNGLGREQVYEKIRVSLGDVERLLNRANMYGGSGGGGYSFPADGVEGDLQGLSFADYGLLLTELSTLKECAAQIPRKFQERFVEDVTELMDVRWTVYQRQETVKRMGRWYPFVTRTL
ncbi:ATP synthase regulation protein NCA2-domain-containing protein [Obelidium mucronatum]|nr:ATP synthase regulation protein NCA2-domain-containing protein [Obelidium mucronatum]